MKHLLLFALTALACLAESRNDIEFARRPTGPLTLDAWVPDGPGPHPAVIIVHGGGWVNGDKQTYVKPLFPVLQEAGIGYFTINYRLAPESHFPDPVHDVEDAVRWVMKNAKAYQVDPQRIALAGESAGGYLVAYVAATSAGKLGLRAVVPIYAPTDLLGRAKDAGSVSENVQKLMDVPAALTPETEKRLRDASPYYHVSRSMPPILLIHGTADKQVPYKQSPQFQERLKQLGVPCELITVEGGGHGMGSWAQLPSQPWKAGLVEWLQRQLRKSN